MLTRSTGTNYVPNEHEDVVQHDPHAIPSDTMPCQSYPESLVNQNEIPVDLSHQWAQLALIMALMSMKIFTNMAHLQYHPR